MKNKSTHFLFSYGTLQQEKVQIETYGRKLTGKIDTLESFEIKQQEIINENVIKNK